MYLEFCKLPGRQRSFVSTDCHERNLIDYLFWYISYTAASGPSQNVYEHIPNDVNLSLYNFHIPQTYYVPMPDPAAFCVMKTKNVQNDIKPSDDLSRCIPEGLSCQETVENLSAGQENGPSCDALWNATAHPHLTYLFGTEKRLHHIINLRRR